MSSAHVTQAEDKTKSQDQAAHCTMRTLKSRTALYVTSSQRYLSALTSLRFSDLGSDWILVILGIFLTE